MILKVTGMTCEHCQRAVKQALESVEGSQDVVVDLELGQASVRGNPKPEALIAAIETEGYTASLSS